MMKGRQVHGRGHGADCKKMRLSLPPGMTTTSGLRRVAADSFFDRSDRSSVTNYPIFPHPPGHLALPPALQNCLYHLFSPHLLSYLPRSTVPKICAIDMGAINRALFWEVTSMRKNGSEGDSNDRQQET